MIPSNLSNEIQSQLAEGEMDVSTLVEGVWNWLEERGCGERTFAPFRSQTGDIVGIHGCVVNGRPSISLRVAVPAESLT